METFWRLSYEGASIADLTAAMGITPQSLYAAFGSKETLYRAALEHYRTHIGESTTRALNEAPTAIACFEQIFRDSARVFSKTGRPRGCMISTAMLTCATEHDSVADHLVGLRGATLAAFVARIDRAIAEGELRPGTHSLALARFLGAVIQGMSVQAIDGAKERDLFMIADIAIAEVARHQVSSSSPKTRNQTNLQHVVRRRLM